MANLPVNEWVTEVVAEVEDLNEAVLAARDLALQVGYCFHNYQN